MKLRAKKAQSSQGQKCLFDWLESRERNRYEFRVHIRHTEPLSGFRTHRGR